MRFLILCSLCLALLSGCGTRQEPSQPESEGQPVIQLERIPRYETAATIHLADSEPYAPWLSMEPDAVSADTMGDLLCDTLLPNGRSVVCYWEPNSDYTKYWAIRQEDGTLQRFCEEYTAYTEGYAAEPFTDILGQDGFRIIAPRGAAYLAFDYYTLDETGTPRLLATCANDVIEADVNGDGETELLWFYHGGQDIYYIFRQKDALREVCLTDLLSQQEEPWLVFAVSPPTLEEDCLPVEAVQGGWGALSPEAKYLSGRLRFTAEAVYLELDAERAVG